MKAISIPRFNQGCAYALIGTLISTLIMFACQAVGENASSAKPSVKTTQSTQGTPVDVQDLPPIEVKQNMTGTNKLAILISGDGGWWTLDKGVAGVLAAHGVFRVSLFASRLTVPSRRIVFVILRTGHSPSIALHPASRRRSYGRLKAGEGLSEEDLHLSGKIRLQAHECAGLPALWSCRCK